MRREPPAVGFPTVKSRWLLSGFGVVRIGRCDQAGDEGAEERLPAAPGIVDELEEAEIGGQLLPRDAPGGPEPGAQHRPEALGRVEVALAEAVAVLVAGVLAPRVAHGLVPVAPLLQAGVDVVLVRVDEGALGDRGLDDGPDRRLPHVGQHAHGHLAPALEQAQHRRLVLRQRAAPGRAPQPPPAGRAPPLATAAGFPLWPATT